MPKTKGFPFKTAPKVKTTTIGNAEIGTIDLPTYGGLLTKEEIFIEGQSLWDRDVINSEISKLSKSIFDKLVVKPENAKLTLPQVDLMIRRLLYGDYTELTVRDRELIGDYEIEIQEFVQAGESGKESLSALAKSIYDREKARFEDLTTPKADYDAAIRKIVQKYKITIDSDNEILFDFTQEILDFATKLGKESDRRYYTYALMIAQSRIDGYEDVTLGELRDEVGRKFLARLGLFGFRESEGVEYNEVEEFGTANPGVEPDTKSSKAVVEPEKIEARTEAEILKP